MEKELDRESAEKFRLIGDLCSRYGIDTSKSIPVTLFRLVVAMEKDLPASNRAAGRPKSVRTSRKDYRLIGLVRFYVELEGKGIVSACRSIFEDNAIEMTERTTPASIRSEYYKFLNALKEEAAADPCYVPQLDGMIDSDRRKAVEWIVLNQAMEEYGLGGIYKLEERILDQLLSQ